MPMSTTHDRIDPTPAARTHHATLVRSLGVTGAVLAPAAVWAVAVLLFGVDLRTVIDPGAPARAIGLAAVVPVALVVSLLGWALLELLERWTPRARTTWTVIAVAVLLASMAGPLLGGVSATATLTLIAAHVALAAVLITVLYRSSPAHRPLS